jgi:hypothetical protein
MILIGIDPDVDRSGIAVWNTTESRLSGIEAIPFWDLVTILANRKLECSKDNYKIVIEAGWLNKKANWHSKGMGEGVSSRIGSYIGANHQVGKLIEQYCIKYELPYELAAPKANNIFKTKNLKHNRELFEKTTNVKLTGLAKYHQEMIDAAMLIFGRKK